MLKKPNRAQLTIFIILGIIIVAAVALVVYLWILPSVKVSPSQDTKGYIEKCASDAAKEAISIALAGGGDIKPEGTVRYKGKNITYLCYQSNLYIPCVNQRPMLIEHIEKELNSYLGPKISDCLSSLKSQLEKESYKVEIGNINIGSKLDPKKLNLVINSSVSLTKGSSIKNFEGFKSEIMTPIYELARVSTNIVNDEAGYCVFEARNFLTNHPEYNLDTDRLRDYSKIYILTDRASKSEFKFAVRGCALPIGL